MTKEETLLKEICASMVAINEEETEKLVNKALAEGTDVLKIVAALTEGINKVGDKFELMEYFLPELIMAAEIMQKIMATLKPEIEKMNVSTGSNVGIVVANIQGDIHDIGRQILCTILSVSGFKVYDLGHDVKADKIIDKALEVNANIIGLSTLLTTSLPFAVDLFKLLEERKLRDRFKVIMGGGAVTQEYAQQVGADGYGRDARAAVKVVEELMQLK
ncbi:MAG: cobalamin B12-binding domain-containing protein [Bacillota bacterium]|jgi:methylmalonyl-CoA mutase cobalamin-binding domain/chain